MSLNPVCDFVIHLCLYWPLIFWHTGTNLTAKFSNVLVFSSPISRLSFFVLLSDGAFYAIFSFLFNSNLILFACFVTILFFLSFWCFSVLFRQTFLCRQTFSLQAPSISCSSVIFLLIFIFIDRFGCHSLYAFFSLIKLLV